MTAERQEQQAGFDRTLASGGNSDQTESKLSPPLFDLDRPVSLLDRIRFPAYVAYARWKWRDFSKEDRQFLMRLEARGIELPVIWDIGASNGAWSLMVSSAFPNAEVLLFEPLAAFDKTYCSALRNHLERHKNWRLHPHAIGSSNTIAMLYKDGPSYGSSLIASEYAKSHWRAIDVPVRSIESLIEVDQCSPPDVIKIDTQGSEAEIIKGAGHHLSKVKVLLLESWLSRAYGPETPLLDELVDTLRPRGFVLAEIHPGYCDPDGMMHSVDAFFIRQDLAAEYGIQRAGVTTTTCTQPGET